VALQRRTIAEQQPLSCALLTTTFRNFFEDLVLACPGLSVGCFPPDVLGVPGDHNPYLLPYRNRCNVALVTSAWYERLASSRPDDVEPVFTRLRQAADAVVALDVSDGFDLGSRPSFLDRVDLALKAQGIYRDRDLYNMRRAPLHPSHPGPPEPAPPEQRFRPEQLEKLRLSVPCFLAVDRRIRHQIRRAKPDIPKAARWRRWIGDIALETGLAAERRARPPTKLVHCVGGLSHVSRLDLMRLLRELGVSGEHRVTGIPDWVAGTEYYSRVEKVPPDLQSQWEEELRELGVWGPAESRPRYRQSMLAHKAVLAPRGHGEVTYRHAEAWLSGRALVCHDLRGVETMFPFRDGENVIFCSPDWSDLPRILEELESDNELSASIGSAGRQDWIRWCADPWRVLEDGIVRPIREALAAGMMQHKQSAV